ncbi:fungal-specific transcription factor domain-containing protein [Xylaria sp. FL1042]|nr:fungal-specific transcription factor domain-containing protein [Xylaria sp. FL1042]
MGGKRQSGTEEIRSKSTADRPTSESAPKRQRVSRACDQCRAAREKCDGIQPLCFPCASQNRQCSWEEPKKKRGVQTGYIRTLEMALGWIFDKIPESENALHGLLTHEGGQGRLLLAGKDTSAGTRLHRRWRKSTVHAEIERVLSGDAASTRSANGSTPGDESDDDALDKEAHDTKSVSSGSELPNHLKIEGDIPDRTQKRSQWHEDLTAPKSNNITNPIKSPSKYQSPPQPLSPPNTITLPSNHWRLVDIYFSYTHIWFPILEKHELLKTGYSYPDEGLHITRDASNSAGHAELWAALALASYQETASRTSEGAQEALTNPTYIEPRDIYRTARSLIPSEDGCFETRHINALLLLTLVNMACNDLRVAWLLIGVATRIALSLRLHENLTSTQHKQSTHTYMGCFILDTLLSARLGLVPHLRSSMAHINIPRLDNDLDEWQPWMPCSDFGPSKRDARPSRMPSHSISSFGILHKIHLVLSRRLWDGHENSPQSRDALLRTLHNAVRQCGAHASLSNCVLTGEYMTGQLPSIHLLRLAYLYASGLCQDFPYLHRAVLSCAESYMGNFGICGLSPLFSVFMKLVDQLAQTDCLTRGEREQWQQIEKAIQSVWTESPRHFELNTGVQDIQSTRYAQHSNPAFALVPDAQTRQQHPTTTLFPNTNINHGSANMGILFSQDLSSKIPGLANHHQPPSEAEALHLNGHSTAMEEFQDMDALTMPSSVHPPETGRASFSSAALDYDTILDDIASIERTSIPESETQFMANLGLRPGTNLADVFSHEFIGFS